MIYNERNIRKEIVLEAAKQIMMAARTAPKGKGVDIIEIITLSHDSLPTLSENMRSEGKKRGMMFFLRDADNIEQADAVILIGTRRHPLGLNCAYCGAKTCGENPKAILVRLTLSMWESLSDRLVQKLPISVSTPG